MCKEVCYTIYELINDNFPSVAIHVTLSSCFIALNTLCKGRHMITLCLE